MIDMALFYPTLNHSSSFVNMNMQNKIKLYKDTSCGEVKDMRKSKHWNYFIARMNKKA